MSQITLKAEKRVTGKQAAKRLRREDKVPGIYYHKGEESIPIQTEPLYLRPVVYTKETHIINLEIEGNEPKECVLKDITFDPVSDKITHFDLIGVTRGQIMTFELPVVLSGSALGVREGGIVQQNIHKLVVRCKPSDLPSSVTVDISQLDIGNSIYVGTLELEGVEIEASDETPIVSCTHSRVSRSDMGEEEEGVEGELGVEGTESVEGEESGTNEDSTE